MTESDRIHARLKRDIITCVFPPSKSLSEAELSKRYRSSRTPVREACQRLQGEGLMVIIPFRGNFIAPLTVTDFHNLQESQLILDPAAAAYAAQRATLRQIEAVEASAHYEYRIGVGESYYEFLQRNVKLHVGIAQASGNDFLAGMVSSIHTRLMRFFYLGLSMDAYGLELVKEHCEIVDAIKARDSERARKCAHEHVINTIRRSAGLFQAATDRSLGVRRSEPALPSELVL